MQDVAAGKEKRVMIFMPPRHGKSELASIKFPAWYLGKFPTKEVMCCSATADLAEDFARKTRDAVGHEVHQAMFPDCRLKKGSKSVSNWRVSNRGGFRGTGIGGLITGMGANLLIIDDPYKDRAEADSETIRRSTFDWFTSTAYTRLEKDGAIVIILTRWHDDDLAGRLLELDGKRGDYYDKKEAKWKKFVPGRGSGKMGKWKVVSFPAIATENEKFRKKGEALWPEKYNLETLVETKASIGLRDWGALYQQDPVIEEGAEFQASWFRYWEKLPKNLRYVTTVDPAISQRETADDSVVITTGIAPDSRIYVVDVVNGHFNPDTLINEIFKQQRAYGSLVAIEAIAYQQALVHYVQKKMKAEKRLFQIEQVRHATKKEERIRGLIPYYSNGEIYHAPGGCQGLEDQLKRFPSGKHDDMIDALAMALPYLRRPLPQGAARRMPLAALGINYTKDGKPYIKQNG